MMHDQEITRAARRMIDNHGARAAAEAERRASNLGFSGESDAAVTWQRIAAVVREIEAARR